MAGTQRMPPWKGEERAAAVGEEETFGVEAKTVDPEEEEAACEGGASHCHPHHQNAGCEGIVG